MEGIPLPLRGGHDVETVGVPGPVDNDVPRLFESVAKSLLGRGEEDVRRSVCRLGGALLGHERDQGNRGGKHGGREPLTGESVAERSCALQHVPSHIQSVQSPLTRGVGITLPPSS